MMDRAEAIMMLNVIATNLVGEVAAEKDGKRAENAMRLINAVDMAISALREQEQSPWISVKERLPEDGDLVLVLVDGKPHKNITLDGAYQLAEYDPKEKEWILEMWPEWLGAKVTHWMPLPEPPKEGADHE